LFGYYVVFPYGFKFFTSFATEYISPMITTREFLSFSTRILLAFGLIFELPLVALVLARLGLISARFLRRQRKYAVIMVFAVAAILTPTPDVVNQCLMAAPLLVLYEMSVWIAYFFGRKEKETTIEKEQEAQPAA
jgi:sec-independent protein translocase protein TatC